MRPVAILGNGGHARVLGDALRLTGTEHALIEHDTKLTDAFASWDLALGMGSRRARREVIARHPNCKWATIIHDGAIVSASAHIGEGAQIMAGAIIQPGAKIGKHAIINTGAQVDHGCVIGDFAHICPGAVLCADVTVAEGSMVTPGTVIPRGFHWP